MVLGSEIPWFRLSKFEVEYCWLMIPEGSI